MRGLMSRRWCASTTVCLLLVVGCSEAEDKAPNASAPLLDEYVLSSEDSIPEGVTFDPVEPAFYVSSLNGGGLTRLHADGREDQFAAPSGARVAGIKVD